MFELKLCILFLQQTIGFFVRNESDIFKNFRRGEEELNSLPQCAVK